MMERSRAGAVAAMSMLTLWSFGIAAQSREPMSEPAAALSLLEAIEMTLAQDPNIALSESQLVFSQGVLESTKGAFDPLLSANLTQDDTKTSMIDGPASESSALSSEVSLEQLLRSGLAVTPSVELMQVDAGASAVNQATVSFTFRQPLLRGRGRAVTTAGERAAERQVEAGRHDLEHRIAQRLLAVGAQYWAVKAAAENLEILRASEESSRTLLETTRRLIAADVTPAAELTQLQADLAAKQVNRIAAERSLFQARQELGREIGREIRRIGDLPLPGDPFPAIDPDDVPRPEEGWHFTERALELRADLAAQRALQAAAELRLHAAENAVEPRLDLVFTPSYSGSAEGDGADDFFSPLYTNVPGLTTSLGLRFAWPTFNRGARGDLVQALAGRDQSALLVRLGEQDVAAAVAVALDAVRQSALQLEKVVEAEGFFEQTVENERKKLRAGNSTLIDVITQRDRLTAIQQQRLSAQSALARAILDLRFQTGTLFDRGTAAGGGTVATTRENLTTLPFD